MTMFQRIIGENNQKLSNIAISFSRKRDNGSDGTMSSARFRAKLRCRDI